MLLLNVGYAFQPSCMCQAGSELPRMNLCLMPDQMNVTECVVRTLYSVAQEANGSGTNITACSNGTKKGTQWVLTAVTFDTQLTATCFGNHVAMLGYQN